MIKIDIFKENHRFSEKTPHPGPRSVVGAATWPLAAAPQAAAGEEPISAVCDPVVLTEKGV
jgi:hypothetical protein